MKIIQCCTCKKSFEFNNQQGGMCGRNVYCNACYAKLTIALSQGVSGSMERMTLAVKELRLALGNTWLIKFLKKVIIKKKR